MADLSGTFRKPFAEQVAAFRLRLGDLVPTSAWDDLVRAQHDRAFMVAGAVQGDLLTDLAQAVDRAVSDGTGFEAFKKDFWGIVAKRGWHGWTGEGTLRGEEWRMRTIYRTNMRTSYMAGRFAQLRAGNFRYWVYRHSGAAHPRLDHLSWDGLVLPPDHPFWQTHYPPNGWGCGCMVYGVNSLRSARRMGGDPGKALPEGWDTRDPRTGAPPGVGKNWDYAPGASVSDTVRALAPKLEDLPPQVSIDLIQSWLNSNAFTRWQANPTDHWPLARIPRAHAERIGSKEVVAKLSSKTMAKQIRNHGELTSADYLAAQRTISGASQVVQDSAQSLIYLLDDPAGHLIVVKATVSGKGLFVSSLRRMSVNATERARLIRQYQRRAMK